MAEVSAPSPEGWALPEAGCFSMNEGSPLVTKSRALRAGFEGLTPAESQTAESLSAQSVLVMSGETTPEILAESATKPGWVMADVAELARVLEG